MHQFQLTFLFVLFTSLLSAQTEYEPGEKFPFGRPNPEAPEQIKEYQAMIGECNCLSSQRKQDGTWAEPEKAVWRFKYIMNGWAVQDETFKETGWYAGSIRQFSTETKKWYVHYYTTKGTPANPLPSWEGELKDDKMVLLRPQQAPNGMEGFYRLTFYEMNDHGYKWIGEWVSEDQSIVYPTWKIDCSKKP